MGSTAVPARRWRTSPRRSSLVMPPSSTWSHPSPCASRLSPSTHHLVDSLSVLCDQPLPSVSSSPSRSPRLLARSPSPLPRPVRSKMSPDSTPPKPFLLSALLFYSVQLLRYTRSSGLPAPLRRFFEIGLV